MRSKAPRCERCKSEREKVGQAMHRLYVKAWLLLMKNRTWSGVGWICPRCLYVIVDEALWKRVDWRTQKTVIEKDKTPWPNHFL